MNARRLTRLDAVCLALINFYQRHLSPRKGYRCAHARLHGGAGCSGFARDAIEHRGLRAALPQVRARFGACKAAAQTLRAERRVDLDKREPHEKKKPQELAKSDWSHGVCDALWIMPDGFCCAEAACEGAACADIGCAEAACGCLPCW